MPEERLISQDSWKCSRLQPERSSKIRDLLSVAEITPKAVSESVVAVGLERVAAAAAANFERHLIDKLQLNLLYRVLRHSLSPCWRSGYSFRFHAMYGAASPCQGSWYDGESMGWGFNHPWKMAVAVSRS